MYSLGTEWSHPSFYLLRTVVRLDFLLPLSLRTIQIELSEFPDNMKDFFCDRLRELDEERRDEEQECSSSSYRTERTNGL